MLVIEIFWKQFGSQCQTIIAVNCGMLYNLYDIQ